MSSIWYYWWWHINNLWYWHLTHNSMIDEGHDKRQTWLFWTVCPSGSESYKSSNIFFTRFLTICYYITCQSKTEIWNSVNFPFPCNGLSVCILSDIQGIHTCSALVYIPYNTDMLEYIRRGQSRPNISKFNTKCYNHVQHSYFV